MKFFVDGQRSLNLLLLQKTISQGQNKNFFENVFTNVLPDPQSGALKHLAKYFKLFVKDPFHLSISHLSRMTLKGQPVAKPVDPYQIFFTSPLKMASNTTRDFRDELGDLNPGTVIYELTASKVHNGLKYPVGKLILRSRFVTSEYGDLKLFFQHERYR